MIETLRKDLFKLEIPLPKNPLRAVNCYIIKSPERNLIIDTAMNRPECLEVMQKGLKELDIDLNRTDLFITHLHTDHSGLISKLMTPTTKVYSSKADGAIINYEPWDLIRAYAVLNGFPDEEDIIAHHPGVKYKNDAQIDFTIVKDGDEIKVGDYLLRVVHTPGHTEGHMCLYEPNKKLFFSGDHVLGKITPNISMFADDENPLGDYLLSLDKVYKIPVDQVYPAHRMLFKDFYGRIDELKMHHKRRLDECLTILKGGAQTAYDVASQMKWDMSYKHWSEFPTAQKWFATGEAISHLKYLETKGFTKTTNVNNKTAYRLS